MPNPGQKLWPARQVIFVIAARHRVGGGINGVGQSRGGPEFGSKPASRRYFDKWAVSLGSAELPLPG